MNQFELHPYFANEAAVTASRRYSIAVEAHSPLGHNNAPLTDETITEIRAAVQPNPLPVARFRLLSPLNGPPQGPRPAN